MAHGVRSRAAAVRISLSLILTARLLSLLSGGCFNIWNAQDLTRVNLIRIGQHRLVGFEDFWVELPSSVVFF